MQFLSELLLTLVTSYLAVTNAAASSLLTTLHYDAALVAEERGFSQIDNATLPGPIPDILIKNTSFQEAALIGSQLPESVPAASLEDALVNVYCTYTTREYVRQTTGSGFIVSPHGVILTNAHVAQFLLLAAVPGEGTAECVVRTGTDAVPTYAADLLYISPAWIQEHAALIRTERPRGTGERDYALLYIAERLDGAPLPARLPYVRVDTSLVRRSSVGETVTIGGYPTDPESAELTVNLSTATTTLIDLYTFGTNYGDIYLLGGSPIGQSGISGGPVMNSFDEAIALIVTRGDDSRQGAGSLNAITLSYVHRTMEEETGFGFSENISGNLPFRSRIFKETLVPFLAGLLAAEL